MKEKANYRVPTFDWASLAREGGLKHPPPSLERRQRHNNKGECADVEVAG